MTDEHVSLRDYFEAKHGAHAEIHDAETRERELTRVAMERRLDGMNEFRKSLEDQRGAFVSRELFDAAVGRIGNLERLVPIVALLSAAMGGALAAGIIKLAGG